MAKVNISLRVDAKVLEEADRHVEWMREHQNLDVTRSDALRMAISVGQMLGVQHREKEGWVSDDRRACELCGKDSLHADLSSVSSPDGEGSFYVCQGCLAE